jgi:protein TonB
MVMFESTMIAMPGRADRAWSAMAGFAAQCAMLTAAVLVPMMFPDSLPSVRSIYILLAPSPPPPPPPPAQELSAPRSAVVRHLQLRDGVLLEPRTMPARPQMLIEEPLSEAERSGRGGVPGGVAGGVDGGVVGSMLTDVLNRAATAVRVEPPTPKPLPAEPVKTAAPAPLKRVVVGGAVQEAMLINRVMPVYPALARQARISGDVVLHGVIGTDGRIRELRLLRGHPLLAPAALDAVRQWVYRPTRLNGVPVEVEAPITVHFTLI